MNGKAIPDATIYASMFADYLRQHPVGYPLLYTQYSNGNYNVDADVRDVESEAEKELVTIFNKMSPSQRKKVLALAERILLVESREEDT